jgi:ORF6N domain
MATPLRHSRASAVLVPKEAPKRKAASLIPVERFASRIYWLRRRQVMFDFDLAELYGVTTKSLNQAVTRNLARFPEDFMFRLTAEEIHHLNRSQFVTGSQRHRDPKFPPRAFTQEGVAMLSGLLRSRRAIQVNLGIMRAFVRLRDLLATNTELARKIGQHDRQIATLFEHVRAMLVPARTKKNPIGFILHKS